MATGYKNPQNGTELRKSGVGNNAKPKASLVGGVGRDTAVRQSDPGPQVRRGGDTFKQTGYRGKGIL
jgi:hypothetical protein